MAFIGYDQQTTTYGAPALAYPKPSAGAGTSVPPNTGADSGNSTEIVIPLLLTSYSPPNRRPKVQSVTTIPIMNGSTSYAGSTISESTIEFAKTNLEGTIETPCTLSSGSYVSTFTIDNIRLHYIEYMIACFEGRVFMSSGLWSRTEPNWFRDPYGRRYDRVKVLDISGNYTEAVPTRTSFSINLMLPGPNTF